MSLFQQIESECPPQLVANILSFAGLDTIGALAKTNKFWNQVTSSEELWQVLCIETQKWKSGEQPMPTTTTSTTTSWKNLYMTNILLPGDFADLSRANQYANSMFRIASKNNNDSAISPTIRLLLAPNNFQVNETLVVKAKGFGGKLIIEAHADANATTTTISRCVPSITMVSSKHSDQSLIHLKRGALDIKNIKIQHYSTTSSDDRHLPQRNNISIYHHIKQSSSSSSSKGTNNSRTNAAVYLRAATKGMENDDFPNLTMEGVEVTSISGNGIVSQRGGDICLDRCYVHHCASNGIFFEGTHDNSFFTKSDITHNGRAGINLTKGQAHVVDCNISENGRMGVSVNTHQAMLWLENSCVVNNNRSSGEQPQQQQQQQQQRQQVRPLQLHLQRFAQNVFRNNTVSTTGVARRRSFMSLSAAA